MLFTNFEANGKEYKLRLTTQGIVELEKKIGKNPLMVFGLDGGTIPSITEMVAILHASLQHFHHGVTMQAAYTIFDEYLADGHITTDFFPVIMDIYKVSGIVRNDKKEEDDEKNS